MFPGGCMRMTRGLAYLSLCMASSLWSMPAPPVAIQPGSSQEIEIAPETTKDFALHLPPGKVSTVAFLQTESTVRIRTSEETSSTADAHFNQGGRLTSIVFHAAGLHAPADGLVLFLVENKGHRVAKCDLTVSAARTPKPSDLRAAQAEEESARALSLPALQSTDSVRQGLPVFEAAEADWRSMNENAALIQLLSVHAYVQAFMLNDQASAVRLLPHLLELAGGLAAAQPAEAANAFKTAGFIQANQSHYEEALKQYGQALSLFETTGDLFNRVVMLENRSKIERIQGDNARALADVNAALPLARQNHDGRGEEALEVERGAIAYESGELGPAYEADLRAIAVAQSLQSAPPQPSGLLEAEAWSDLALVYLDLHDYEQASQALDHAEAIWRKSPNTYGQLETRENRAELRLAQGDITGARTVFEEGADEAKAQGLTREHVAFLRGIAACDLRNSKFDEAEAQLHQATQEAEQSQITDELSALYSGTGDVEAAQGHWDRAAEAWHHAEDAAQKRGHDLDHSIALAGLARAALHLDQLDEAHASCQQAMTAIESVRRQINDNDLRLSFFSSRHALYDLCVQIDMRRNDPESAFSTAERSRARNLLDQAVSSGIQLEIPEEFLARMDANQRSLSEARKALNGLSKQPARTASTNQMQSVLEQRAALRQEAQQHGYDLAFAAATMPFTEREVADHLDADTALIAFWEGAQQSYVWLVTRASALVKTLPASSALDAHVHAYLDLLSESMPASASGSATERAAAITRMQSKVNADGTSLRRLLMPFVIPPGIKRLLLVKDGALLSLSFATLPGPASTYLSTRYELATEPSATFAFRVFAPRASESPARVVAFIDPSSTAHEVAATSAAAQIRQVTFRGSSTADAASPSDAISESPSWTSPLPYAREEAQVLAETFGTQNATIFTGPAATRAQALSLDWSSYSLAHFAAHAVYRKTHPELSGIVLSLAGAAQKATADSQMPPMTALLTFSDVLRMKTPPPLVVLSACSSGIGSFVPGEGMLALDTAFLASGSSQVVSTLWPVDDQASSVFMRAFYRAFATTHSAIQSMQMAQRFMATSREWSAPYFWGAFTLSGDWHNTSSTSLSTQP